MSELNIKIRKLQDNGSTFRATPESLYMGGVGSAKVDTLCFDVPEEWKGCAITLHVQRLSGTLPDPQLLDEKNRAVVDQRWTKEKQGLWMLMAVGADGYTAMTKPGRYTCYETIDRDSTTETITPSVYEQFVALVKKETAEANRAAKNAAASAEIAKNFESTITATGEQIQREITATADQTKQAVDEKAKAALASIPEDYTTLSESVGQLKEDLGNYYFKTIIKPVYTTQEIIVGVINDSNGQVVGINGNSTVYLQELEADELKISAYLCKTLAFYDVNKTFISVAITDANGWTTADIPLNAKYVSYSWEDDSDFAIVYGSEQKKPLYSIGVPTTLEEKVDNYIVGLNMTPNQCSFLKIGLNLFNKNEELQDKFLNDGIISDLNDYCVSDYIPVKKDNTYVCNKDLPKYDLFDSKKKFIKEFAYTAGQPIVPTKDGYIVICYYSPTSDKHTSDEMMVCMGDTVPTYYKSFCYYPNSTEKYPVDFNETWYKDKYICTFGDSNTANARWQDFMCNNLKCTYQNCGIGGSSMAGTDEHAMWTDFRINQISEKTNVVLIMAGTNDGASSREVGVMSLDNTDTNTFVGAYNTCIRKIYTKMGITFPIFLFTPIPCFDTTTYPRVKEMAHAVKEIGAMWSLPVIDAQNECGINVANWESLYASDGVHVDYEGGKMLASLVVGILKAHEPID